MSRRVVLATQNEHKVHELRQILADVCRDLDLEIVSATAFPEVPDVTETEVTFAGNARLKAEALAAATGLPALADDSGLAVEVLGGCPGASVVTPGPTSRTMPAPSWPKITGNRPSGSAPERVNSSV
jgi:non-canonical purine NTP pyrophosphatase (RdgB/HAM1 family)